MDGSKPLIEQIKEILVKELHIKRDPSTISADTYLFNLGPYAQEMPSDAQGQPGLDTLNLDSIDSLEIIIALEKNFGITVTDEELKEPEKIFRTLGTLTEFVENKIKRLKEVENK